MQKPIVRVASTPWQKKLGGSIGVEKAMGMGKICKIGVSRPKQTKKMK